MTIKLKNLIIQSLKEDAPNGDITTQTFVPNPSITQASIVAKQSGVFYGKAIIEAYVTHIDPRAQIEWIHCPTDGPISKSDIICHIRSQQDLLLLIERPMLNLIQRLSGIATLTQTYIQTLNTPSIHICDTRKTTPGLRSLEKAAVKAGGGTNHRHGLSDMILIKENHLTSMMQNNQLAQLNELVVKQKKANPNLKAEIEIENIEQLTTLNLSSFDYILLDNFPLESLKEAISISRKNYPNAEIEVSGNITLDTLPHYAHYDINRISIGALTHSPKAFDLSMLI